MDGADAKNPGDLAGALVDVIESGIRKIEGRNENRNGGAWRRRLPTW
jgi:hypothetical protein